MEDRSNEAFVGIDLVRETVAVIARYEESVRDAYLVRAYHSDEADGTIYLLDDGTHNGRRAVEIAVSETADGEVGLGWRFARAEQPATPSEARTVLVHLNVEVPASWMMPYEALAESVSEEVRAALEVATDDDHTPILSESSIVVTLAEEV